ncbi:hypothetical protein IV102_17910 [bacterium]|nr:hypothetical protein [bacterium]
MTTPYLNPLRTTPLPPSTPVEPRSRDLSAPSLKPDAPPKKSIRDIAQLSPSDAQELKLWEKRYQNQLGLLKTPPRGQVGQPEKFAKAYLEQLVQQLAGDEIQAQGLDVRVELFGGTIPQAALDDSNRRELEWESQHPGQEWPVRTWLGAEPGNQPLYRIVVTEGLLEQLETREELAFVLANQVEKLLQHHAHDPNNEVPLECKGRSWVDSREQQMAIDSAALARMCKANLNPQGALKSLNTLYSKYGPHYSGEDQKIAVEAVAQVQEHEGVRFSALQAQIEQLRRSGEPATLTPIELLPRDRFPQAPGEYESRLENFAAFRQGMDRLANDLSGDQTPAWMFNSQSAPSPVTLLKALRPSPADLEEALLGLCDQLQQSGKTPQQQVDGFLRVVLAFQGDLLPESMAAATLDKARAFLAGNLESGGWQPQPLLQSLSSPQGSSLHRALVTQVLQNQAFQSVLAPLVAAPGPMQSLLRSGAENYLRLPENGQPDLHALPLFLQRNHKKLLAPLLNQGAVEVLQRQSPPELATRLDDCGLPQGLVLCNDLRRLDHESADFACQLRQAMEPIQRASNEVREDNARLRLRPPLTESLKLSAYLQELFASEAGQPFSPSFDQQLPALLQDVVRSCHGLIEDNGRPRELEAGLERRLCAALSNGPAQDKAEILEYLGRHWSHELRLPTHSARREWTGATAQTLAAMPVDQLLASLTPPPVSPYSETLRQSLMTCYQLSDEALPDTSSARLAALDQRRQQGEFEPKIDHYASPEDYQLARQAYQDRCDALKSVGRYISCAEGRQTLSHLAMLGQHSPSSLQVASQLSPQQWVGLLESAEQAVERSRLVRSVSSDLGLEALGSDAGNFLMDGFMAVEAKLPELDRFWDLAQRTVELSPLAIQARQETRGAFAQSLFQRLDRLEIADLKEWLGKDHLLDVLKPEQTHALMQKILGPITPEMSISQLTQATQELDASYALKAQYPAVYALIRDDVTEKARLQPGTVDQVFPPQPDGAVDLLQRMQGPIAGLSGLVAVTRNHTPGEQLATIEYIMGRADEMPAFLESATENQSLGPVAEALRSARQELMEAQPAVRVMVANSFLAGPTGLMNCPGGKDTILRFVLEGVDPKFLQLARPMIQAVLFSQGDAESLAVAMVLASKPKAEGDKKLTEADILNRVFDSYGVPGVKMKQYLAFTSQFERFRETFESAQDAANPLTYYQTVRLIQTRFGDQWPADLQVDKTLGSGSVNVAIRYRNESKGKREVVSLGREDIVEATRYDFERFHRFVDALTATPEGAANFGFVRGLIGIVQESVQLEFDKEAARQVQHQAYQTYKHKFADGWTVKSIDAFEAKNLGLFMEEGKGKTARKVLNTNPELYRKTMRHMAEVEFQLLKGQDSEHQWAPRPNFANPDFHDGQVLIDEETKTVTMLDFGQAVPISNEEREGALDLLTVLGKLDSDRKALERLNARFFPNSDGPNTKLTLQELDSIWTGPELQGKNLKAKKMDCFIRLLAVISQKGGKVPLSTVHWVLALNRQYVLGEKLKQGIKAQLVGMVLNHKLGLSLKTYNMAHDTAVASLKLAGSVAHGLVGWALPDCLKGPDDLISMLQSELGPDSSPN